MDIDKIEREMRLLAEQRIDKIAGENAILLTKRDAAQICGRSTTWVDLMVAIGRLPTVKIGRAKWLPRPVLVEALVKGV